MYTKINLLGRQFPLQCMFPLQNHHSKVAHPNICISLIVAGVPAPLPILYLPTNNTSDIASVSEATYGSKFWCHQYSQTNILQGFQVANNDMHQFCLLIHDHAGVQQQPPKSSWSLTLGVGLDFLRASLRNSSQSVPVNW